MSDQEPEQDQERITITLDRDVYEELVRQAGGPRKISKFLNPVIRQALYNADSVPPAEMETMRTTLRQVMGELENLNVRLVQLEQSS